MEVSDRDASVPWLEEKTSSIRFWWMNIPQVDHSIQWTVDKVVIIYKKHNNTLHSPLVLTWEVIDCFIKHGFWSRILSYQANHFVGLFLLKKLPFAPFVLDFNDFWFKRDALSLIRPYLYPSMRRKTWQWYRVQKFWTHMIKAWHRLKVVCRRIITFMKGTNSWFMFCLHLFSLNVWWTCTS